MNSPIFQVQTWLSDAIQLHVHLVKGVAFIFRAGIFNIQLDQGLNMFGHEGDRDYDHALAIPTGLADRFRGEG